MLFHPSPEPTAPLPASCDLSRARIIPEHYHGFAQVWFILKGEA